MEQTLNNLINNENKDLLPKIKKFIAIGPPFVGATKLLDAFLHGIEDFNAYIIIEFQKFGQFLMLKSVPTIAELRPLPIISKLFSDDYYSEFAQAIRERLSLEESFSLKNLTNDEIFEKSKLFNNLFKGYFPDLTDPDCEYESIIQTNSNAYNKKCFTQIYNIGDCPVIIALDQLRSNLKINLNYCNKTDDNLYYPTECGKEKMFRRNFF